MSGLRVPFSRPCFSDEDLDEILSEMRVALKSGWLTSGRNVEWFELAFAELVGTSYAVALNSCTAGLHATLLSLGIKAGDEVIVPSNTFVATANAVVYTGARPVFADSDPNTFNISLSDVKAKISSRTKALIAVHLAGNPCDMRELRDVADDNGLFLIEDCAHAHGSLYAGRNCGTFGVAGVFSFYPTKIMTTCEGGMVTTDSKDVAEKVRRIRNHGRGGYGPLEVTDLGFNYRLSDVHAIIGLSQLKRLSGFLAHRSLIASYYASFLSRFEWVKPQLVREGNVCSYYAYVVRLTSGAPMSREDFVRKLGEKGVGTSVIYHPVHAQPLYLKMFGAEPRCPVAVELGKQSLALPIFNGMKKGEVDFVKESILETVEPLPRQLEA